MLHIEFTIKIRPKIILNLKYISWNIHCMIKSRVKYEFIFIEKSKTSER